MIVPRPSPTSSITFLGNSLRAWLTAGITDRGDRAARLAGRARRVIVSRTGKLAERTTNQIDDTVVAILRQTRTWVLVAASVLMAMEPLHSAGARRRSLVEPATSSWCSGRPRSGESRRSRSGSTSSSHRTGTHDRTSVAMISAMGVGAKVLIWILISLTAIKSVFGIEITALITTLGVSGIAIALAVQNILGDILAALAIVFDKPFDVGDSIGVDTITGVVEHIGLKTTRIRSVTGEQIILGNGDLLKSRLRNYRRMSQRRVLFNLDVPFDTPAELLKRIPSMLEKIVTAQAPVQFDRSHVASFTESGVRIETVYFVLDPDYKLYMNIQQGINLEILNQFNAEKLKFALPSRTVYHEGPNAKDLAVGTQPQTAADAG